MAAHCALDKLIFNGALTVHPYRFDKYVNEETKTVEVVKFLNDDNTDRPHPGFLFAALLANGEDGIHVHQFHFFGIRRFSPLESYLPHLLRKTKLNVEKRSILVYGFLQPKSIHSANNTECSGGFRVHSAKSNYRITAIEKMILGLYNIPAIWIGQQYDVTFTCAVDIPDEATYKNCTLDMIPDTIVEQIEAAKSLGLPTPNYQLETIIPEDIGGIYGTTFKMKKRKTQESFYLRNLVNKNSTFEFNYSLFAKNIPIA